MIHMVIPADPQVTPLDAVTAYVWVVIEDTGVRHCVIAATAMDAAAIVLGRAIEWPRLTIRRATEHDVDLDETLGAG